MPSFHFVTRKRVWLTANVTLPPSIYLRDIVPSVLSAIRFCAYSAASISEEAERCYADGVQVAIRNLLQTRSSTTFMFASVRRSNAS
jgi:hypothetical protein